MVEAGPVVQMIFVVVLFELIEIIVLVDVVDVEGSYVVQLVEVG